METSRDKWWVQQLLLGTGTWTAYVAIEGECAESDELSPTCDFEMRHRVFSEHLRSSASRCNLKSNVE